MIVQEFDLAWPKQVNEMLKVFSVISSSQEMIISLDCYLNKSQLAKITNYLPTFYLKVILFGLSPIIFGLLSWLIWILIDIFMKRFKNREINVKLNIQATCFIIVFITYPTITTLSFSLFDCFQIDKDKYYLRRDFSIQCWTQQHVKMALSIGLPFILVWVIGFPSIILYKLYKNRKNLNNLDFISRYGLFFVGLNNDSFFWEVTIQNGRKILFILYNSFLSASQSNAKALLAIVTLFLQSQILGRLNPFIDPRFNQVDFHSQYAAILTLFCGMFFVQEQIQKNNDVMFALFIIVLSYNMFFLTLWVFRFVSVLIRINIDRLRHFQVCSWLNYVKMLTYEEDLEQFIREQNNLMTESPINYRFQQKEKRIQKIKVHGFFEDSSSSDGSITIFDQRSYSVRHQQHIQNKRMLKHATPSNKLQINHDDLLNLPKKSYRNGNKKKGELKKKKGLKPHVLKGISPQFTLTRTNIEIFSQTIKEEDSISRLNSSEIAQSNPQEKEKSYNNRLPYF